MKYRFTAVIMALCLAVGLAGGVQAAQKTIYIKPFAIVQGFPKNDPVGNMIKDYVSEYIIERGGYSIISDDEVKQVMAQEEIKMALDTCYDDACIKKLLESIRTDYMIYGTVAVVDGKYVITIKMLDRTSGTVRLARVKTLEFKNKNKLKMASKDLAAYVVAGRKVDMSAFEEEGDEPAPRKGKPSTGLGASFTYYMPVTSPIKDYYSALLGASLEYAHNFNERLGILGGTSIVGSKDDLTGNARVVLTSFYAGGRFGLPVAGFLYPYAGLLVKGIWYYEKGQSDSASFGGYGGDIFAGCAFFVWEGVSIYADYRFGLGRLFDKAGTDISGGTVNAGVRYSF